MKNMHAMKGMDKSDGTVNLFAFWEKPALLTESLTDFIRL